jgi:hypothetical protein
MAKRPVWSAQQKAATGFDDGDGSLRSKHGNPGEMAVGNRMPEIG